MKSFKNFRNSCYQLKEMHLWDFMHKKYKGTFYRGVGKGGRGTGLGALGMRVYLTWSESMAQTFAKHQEKRNRPFVFINKNKRFGKQK